MKTIIKICCQLLFICIVIISCKKENPVETPLDKTEHYFLQTIDGLTLAEHKIKSNLPDYPLEIIFIKNNDSYDGSVLFERISKRNIDTSSVSKSWLVVNIKNNELYHNIYLVVFDSMNFNNNSLNCMFTFLSTTADFRKFNLVFIKK